MDKYDSREDTIRHINMVGRTIKKLVVEMQRRAVAHDYSKLQSPEKEAFDKTTPLLNGLTYGSAEYKQALASMKPALEHHYANNSHHPEHYENGIDGMDLIDLLEMLVDWYCSSKRHEDGDIFKSLEINKERFGYSDQLASVFKNTLERYIIN